MGTETNPPQVSQPVLTIYKARLDQIDFIKKQQWVVTNYAVLIFAAIIWMGSNVPTIPINTLAGIVILAAITAITLLVWFQHDVCVSRKLLDKANDYCFSGAEREALNIQSYKHPFARGLNVLVALIGVCVVGAVTALFSLGAL
jgi:hypothetical protein